MLRNDDNVVKAERLSADWKMSDELKAMFTEVVIPEILKTDLQQRDKGKGVYTTSGQQAIAFDTADGGYGRLSFAVTCFPASRTAKAKADDGQRKITLKTGELALLDRLIAETTDNELSLQLRTIKSLNSKLGYVGLDDFIVFTNAARPRE